MDEVSGFAASLRLSLGSLRERPKNAALLVVTLALGIAANIVTASFLTALLIHPYPFSELDRLVVVRERRGDSPLRAVTAADFIDIRDGSEGFDGWAAYRINDRSLSGAGAGSSFAERIRTVAVTPGLFSLIGTRPVHGRVFDDADERALVLSHELWRRRFASDVSVLGVDVVLDGLAFTVVGIMPPSLNFPLGAEAWMPLVLTAGERRDRMTSSLFLLGRVAPGASTAGANAALARLASSLAERYPETNRGRTYDLLPLRRLQYVYTVPFFTLLQLSASLVLLLASVNAASLLWTHRVRRYRHIAVLGVLGASRRDLLTLSVLEAAFLGGAAWVASLPLGYYATELMRNAMPAELVTYAAGWHRLRLDPTSALLAASMTLVASLGFGLATRYRWEPSAAARTLRTGRGEVSNGPTGWRKRGSGAALGPIVAAELALGILLLTGAVYMDRGFEGLIRRFDALEPDGVLVFGLSLPAEHYPDAESIRTFQERFLGALASLPGARLTGALTNLPASNVPSPSVLVHIEGLGVASEAELPSADLQTVVGNPLELFRVPMASGRPLLGTDDAGAPHVVVISETMARRHWPAESPLGRYVRLDDPEGAAFRIVGVARDVRMNWFDPEPRPTIYVPAAQRPPPRLRWAIRVEGASGPHVLIAEVREQLRRIDAELALGEPRSLSDAITESIAPIRIIGLMTTAFAGLAALLAASGIFAVASSNVASRTKELGTRIALGARAVDIIAMVLRQSAKLVGYGLATALPLTWLVTSSLASRLFGLFEPDTIVVLSLAALASATALVATLVPAFRAANIDPIEALRDG